MYTVNIGKKSAICSYFTIKPDAHLVECNTCKGEASCGGKTFKCKKCEKEKAADIDTSQLQLLK